MKQLKPWEFIYNNLQQNIAVMLLYVLESEGSSPGRQGFFMAVNEQDEMIGSIGGGIMEHKFVEMAKEKLRAAGHKLQAGTVRKQVHDKSAAKNQSGMICSGEQTILLYETCHRDKETISGLIDSQIKTGSLFCHPRGLNSAMISRKMILITFLNRKTNGCISRKQVTGISYL
jgi:xanthine dehydrogenase accessory factor